MITYNEAKIDKTLHIGGYPAKSLCVECISGIRWLYKKDLRPDTAINLAKSVWDNRFELFDYTVMAVVLVNQKTGCESDRISEG